MHSGERTGLVAVWLSGSGEAAFCHGHSLAAALPKTSLPRLRPYRAGCFGATISGHESLDALPLYIRNEFCRGTCTCSYRKHHRRRVATESTTSKSLLSCRITLQRIDEPRM